MRLPRGQWFLKFLPSLGYLEEQFVKGHCLGAAYTAIQAMQTDQGQLFNQRLCLIYEIYEKSIYYCLPPEKRNKNDFIFLNKKRNESYEHRLKKIHKKHKNSDDYRIILQKHLESFPTLFSSIKFKNRIKKLINDREQGERNYLLPWFESVIGYQNPLALPPLNEEHQNKIPLVQNRIPIFDNDKLLQSPLIEVGYLSGFYKNENELQQTLKAIEIELNKKNISAPVSFLFRNIDHVVAFTYYPLTHRWQYYDSNHPGIQYTTIPEIAQAINKNLAGEKSMANTMQIFSCKDIHAISEAIKHIKQSEENRIKKGKKSIYDKTDITRLEFDSLGGSWLYTAIASGDFDTVNALLDQTDVSHFAEKAYKGCSPLLIALYFDHQLGENNKKIIDLLLEKYPEHINIPAKDGTTPLSKAIERNDFSLVVKLIERGANIPDTLLHLAIEKGHVEIARHLMEKKNIELITFDRAFIKAVKNGHLEMIKFLLEEKNLNLLNIIDNRMQNALSWAAAKGHLSLLKYLHEEKKLDFNCFTQLKNQNPHRGDTPLNWAIKNGHDHIVDYLLQQGAKSKNMNFAFIEAIKAGHLNIVRQLLEKNPELLHAKDEQNCPALSWAAIRGDLPIVKFLHTQGGNLNCSSYSPKQEGGKFNEYTPLDWAARKNHLSVVQYLLKHKGQSKNICSLLMNAIGAKKIKLIKILCHVYKFNQKTLRLALYKAIAVNNLKIAHYFLDKLSFWQSQTSEIKQKVINLLLSLSKDKVKNKNSCYSPSFFKKRIAYEYFTNSNIDSVHVLNEIILDPSQDLEPYINDFEVNEKLNKIYGEYKNSLRSC